MKNLGKIIGRVCAGALTVSLLPYRISKDKESGVFELRSLLWAVKKTPGQERDRYELELLPFLGGKEAAEETEAAPEEPAAAPEEPAAEPEEASEEATAEE